MERNNIVLRNVIVELREPQDFSEPFCFICQRPRFPFKITLVLSLGAKEKICGKCLTQILKEEYYMKELYR